MSDHNVSLTIDGFPVTVPEGTTILEAAHKVNIKIPTLCDHPDLCKRSVCRICVVECDGRAKLITACANYAQEGMSVVTNNRRILEIRKTIIELLLADHPQDCTGCTRNLNCELQSLAETFCIRETPFIGSSSSHPDAVNGDQCETAGGAIVRDMNKCIKCLRCVEVCQEIQTICAINTSNRSSNYGISTPFKHALGEGACIFCGQCAAVCPVGAISGYDQCDELWSALNRNKMHVVAQIAPAAAAALARELNLSSTTVTSGKIVTALKWMGFNGVYDGAYFAGITVSGNTLEILSRMEANGKLPMISCCSPGFKKFVEEFYPDLYEHLSLSKSPEHNFLTHVKDQYLYFNYPDCDGITFVSIVPCIAKKFMAGNVQANEPNDKEIVLTTVELARMIRIMGIEFENLNESDFSLLDEEVYAYSYMPKKNDGKIESVFWKIYEAYNTETDYLEEGIGEIKDDIKEAEFDLHGIKTKALIVNGLDNTRRVLDSIRSGECKAVLVGVLCCPIENCSIHKNKSGVLQQ